MKYQDSIEMSHKFFGLFLNFLFSFSFSFFLNFWTFSRLSRLSRSKNGFMQSSQPNLPPARPADARFPGRRAAFAPQMHPTGFAKLLPQNWLGY